MSKTSKRVLIRGIRPLHNRGILHEKMTFPKLPPKWAHAQKLAHITFDSGLECLVPASKPVRIKNEDIYEQAWLEPEAFVASLLEASLWDRAQMLGFIARPSWKRIIMPVRDLQGQEVEKCIIPSRAPRYFAILRRLPLALAVDLCNTLAQDWLEDDQWNVQQDVVLKEDHYNPRDEKYGPKATHDQSGICTLIAAALCLTLSDFADQRQDLNLKDVLSTQALQRLGEWSLQAQGRACSASHLKFQDTTYLQKAVRGAVPGIIYGVTRPYRIEVTGLDCGLTLNLPVLTQ